MSAHELARKLLDGPDGPFVVAVDFKEGSVQTGDVRIETELSSVVLIGYSVGSYDEEKWLRS